MFLCSLNYLSLFFTHSLFNLWRNGIFSLSSNKKIKIFKFSFVRISKILSFLHISFVNFIFIFKIFCGFYYHQWFLFSVICSNWCLSRNKNSFDFCWFFYCTTFLTLELILIIFLKCSYVQIVWGFLPS
jgi:hypothetical protein